MRCAAQLLTITLLALGTQGQANGQEGLDPSLESLCSAEFSPDTNEYSLCHDVGTSIQLLQPELGLSLAGGNPVLGTASPLGKKFRFIPRLHIGGRISFVWAEIPDIINYPENVTDPVGTISFSVPMPQLDLSVGIFEGFRLGSTMGGMASVELLGSLGAMILPAGKGFKNDVTGFGLGARIGLLRESFTAPGISLSGMYKWHGRIQFGDAEAGDAAEFGMDMQVASLRVGLSKSFVALALGLTLGYDSYWSDVDFAVNTSSSVLPVPVVPVEAPVGLQSERWSAFLDVSYIILYFNIVAEAGWQEEQRLLNSRQDELKSGNFFGAIGIRLTL
jgi:hypothetical protein